VMSISRSPFGWNCPTEGTRPADLVFVPTSAC
jgi:hypothetical protein